MNLTRLAIQRPLTILMLILGLVIMGAVAYTLLRVDRLPDISARAVSVRVQYPGASPTDVESLVIEPIEQALAGTSGVASISSTSNEGNGNVTVQLTDGYDADKAAVDVERAVGAIRNRLPADVGSVTVGKFDPNATPILNIALSGSLPLDQLYEIGANDIQPQLQSIPGVADVAVSGGLVPEVEVQVDYTKLEGYGLAITSINTALQRENLNTPGGSIDQGRREITVRTVGNFQSAAELNDLVIANTANGPIRLRDVAIVKDTFKPRTSYQRFNGVDAVGLSVTKQSDANAVEVSDAVKAEVARFQDRLPQGVTLNVVNDSARYTRSALNSVLDDLLLAVLLTGAVLLLFLHSWRNTVIVLLAIPTSLISTFLVMFAFGFSLNLMTLLALALVIGVLVDDSIVVLENIHRHIQLGEAPRVAALTGRSEIGLAAITITLVDVVVYVPIAFMAGNVGQLFRQYGWTVAAATLFSLLISFTLTPMLASRWLEAHRAEHGARPGFGERFSSAWERGFDRVARGYGRLIGGALRVRPLVVLIAAFAVGLSAWMMQTRFVGSEYVPQEDDGNFTVSIQMPPGTQLDATDAVVREVEADLSQVPEIKNTFANANGRGGQVAVELVPKSDRSRSVFDVMADVRRFASRIPEARIRPNVANPLGGGFGGVQIRVLGTDPNELTTLTEQVIQTARTVPGVADVQAPTTLGEPEIRAVVDRQRAADLGITAQQVGQALRTALGGTVVGQLRPDGQLQKDITVIAEDSDRLDLNKLATMPISGQAAGGGAAASITGATGATAATTTAPAVRLGQVAQLVQSQGPVSISHQDGQRSLQVNVNVVDRSLGETVQDLRTALKTVSLPAGYQVVVAGQAQNLDVAIKLLLGAGTLSVILIYMLMVALYESWLYPLAIMFSLPVALIGVLIALKLSDNRINIYSMIGIIMLMGIVAKNAILLVDYANTLRSRGIPRNEAVRESGRTRLRPIVMTSITIVAAMIPLALKFQEGAESRAPLAMAVIGGVTSSTLLTLVLVPVMYTYLDDLQELVGRLFRRRFVRQSVVAAPPAIAGGSGEEE